MIIKKLQPITRAHFKAGRDSEQIILKIFGVEVSVCLISGSTIYI